MAREQSEPVYASARWVWDPPQPRFVHGSLKDLIMIKRLIIVLVVLVLIIGGLAGLKYAQITQMMAQMSQPRPPATIAATEAQSETWQPALQAVGSVVAVNGIELTTEVAGVVSEIPFVSGGDTEAGDVLLRLDARVDQAALEALRAEQRLAQVQFKRTADLLKRNAISKSDYDEAKAQYDAAQARVVQQQETVAKKTIRAPFSGALGIRQVDLGEYIEPGTTVVSLQSLDPIYVDYSLPERDFSQLRVGQDVSIKVDAYPGESFEGKVEAISSSLDEGTRSVQVRATLSNPDGRLRPGMFAEVQTLLPTQNDIVTVPRTAISYNTYGDFVFVIEKGEGGELTAKQRTVTTGTVREGRVEIVKGLEAGEQVVRAGTVKLRSGQPVQIDNSVELNDAEVTSE